MCHTNRACIIPDRLSDAKQNVHRSVSSQVGTVLLAIMYVPCFVFADKDLTAGITSTPDKPLPPSDSR